MSEFQSLVSVYYSPRVILQMFSCTVNTYNAACLFPIKALSRKFLLIRVNRTNFRSRDYSFKWVWENGYNWRWVGAMPSYAQTTNRYCRGGGRRGMTFFGLNSLIRWSEKSKLKVLGTYINN